MPAYDDPVDRIHDPVDTSTTDSGRRGEAALPISNLRSARRDKWSKTIYVYIYVWWIYATNKLWTEESRTRRIFYTTRDRGVLIQCDLIKYAVSIRYTVLILRAKEFLKN